MNWPFFTCTAARSGGGNQQIRLSGQKRGDLQYRANFSSSDGLVRFMNIGGDWNPTGGPDLRQNLQAGSRSQATEAALIVLLALSKEALKTR